MVERTPKRRVWKQKKTNTCQGFIQWDNASILASEHQFLKRGVRESLEIQCQGTAPGQGLNKDFGRYDMASFSEEDNIVSLTSYIF